jgi:peptidyl-tRNA hydrolase, PTH2 family
MSIIAKRLAKSELEFDHTDDYLRMYIIMVKELEMGSGKLAAQAAHIAQETILITPAHIIDEYRGNGMGTKLMLKGKRKDIYHIAELAAHQGIICGIGCDRGHILPPHFDGNPVITGIGLMMTKEQSKEYTKRFTFVK